MIHIPPTILSIHDAAVAAGTHSDRPALHVCNRCREWKVMWWYNSSGGNGLAGNGCGLCKECSPKDA